MSDQRSHQSFSQPSDDKVEKFVTLKHAAVMLGVPEFKVRRAVTRKQFPSYRFGNNRALVRMSEVLEAIERLSRQ